MTRPVLAVLCVLLLGPSVASPRDGTFNESFGRGWEQRWTIRTSPVSHAGVTDGKLTFSGPQNAYALIARPVGSGNVRVNARLRSGDGISWCTSLFLYWGAGDWTQVGVIQDGRYYVTETINGNTQENRKSIADTSKWHFVSLELGRNVVRAYASEDGKNWSLLRSIPRPASWKGSATVLVGKGYGTGVTPYPMPNLENSFSDPGPVTRSSVSWVSLAPIAHGKSRATLADERIWNGEQRDTYGDAILKMPGDPTFDRVAKLFPAMKNAREAVGVKDHPNEFIVEPDGAVLFGGDSHNRNAPRAYIVLGPERTRLGSPQAPLSKSVVPGVPMVVQRGTYRGAEVIETVAAWSEGMSPDKETFVYIEIRLFNRTKREMKLPFRLVVEPKPKGSLIYTNEYPLSPGAGVVVTFRAPYSIEGHGFSFVEYSDWLPVHAEILKAWNPAQSTKTTFEVPDPRINKLFSQSLAYAFVNVDKKNGVYEPHDGSGFYEEVFGYSAVLYCNALDLWGYHKDSERYIDSLLTMMKPDGLFEVNYGLSDMGGLLMAMSQHYQMTRDRDWLLRVAPKMKLAADWLIRHRQDSQKLVDGKRPVTYGLIKARPYCDYATPTFTYLSDTYCVLGLEEASRAFAAVGLAEDSHRLAVEAAAYRADVLASMKAAVFDHKGTKMLPMEPETRRLLKDNGYTGGDYYGLVAPMVLENGFLPPSSPYAKLIVNQLENRGGLTLRMCKFVEGIDHAYTYGYWLDLLKRDQVRPVLVGLYGSLAYGMSRETYSAVECTQIMSGLNELTTPHTYSATQQLRLLRMMLLREDGDSLWVGQAMPREWLKGAQKVSVQNAPTLFGDVSFTYQADVRHKRISVLVVPPVSRELKAIHLRVRCPEGTKPLGAWVDGRRVKIVNETVEVVPSGKAFKLVVKLK